MNFGTLIAFYVMKNNGLSVPNWLMIAGWIVAGLDIVNIILKAINKKLERDIMRIKQTADN